MKKFLEQAAIWLFIIASAIGILGAYICLKAKAPLAVTMGFVLFNVLLWGITILCILISDKKKEKKRKQYEKEFIEKTEIEDDFFGKVFVTYDKNVNHFDAECDDKKRVFAGRKVSVYFTSDEGIEEIKKEINLLKTFCQNADSLPDRIYKEFAMDLKGVDVYDKDGNDIEITEDFMREELEFYDLSMNDLQTVVITASWEDSGSQDYEIEYNLEEDKLDFILL